jgi:hypothetical protein
MNTNEQFSNLLHATFPTQPMPARFFWKENVPDDGFEFCGDLLKWLSQREWTEIKMSAWTMIGHIKISREHFMLVGRAVRIGERFRNLPLIVPTLHKSFVFLVLLVVLTLIEEIVVGAIHGETIMHSVSGIAGGTLHQLVATILIIFLILTPYFAFRSLGQIIGDKILVRLFFERRHGDR